MNRGNMTLGRTVELLQIERECVRRAATCTRHCEACPLVQDDKELVQAYDQAIDLLSALKALLGEEG